MHRIHRARDYTRRFFAACDVAWREASTLKRKIYCNYR